ncbi:hypothetical protein RhiirA1_388763 [Rhizophagus irregularis]|uniref:Uncharacterized protein n=1 Tax=Rhizophagus irregularis TaxID=588596 RepID=A0A2I1EZJ2_9GLOM|nr:hypothetical protein RhiirA1_388763 [Rhizophagus irregularis]PKY27535.1 hypothetical protein RhiirB3_390370 [Rhizophagus irregularis]CAB5196138.1 unnamed protein product [Rhizophagus irregularis]
MPNRGRDKRFIAHNVQSNKRKDVQILRKPKQLLQFLILVIIVMIITIKKNLNLSFNELEYQDGELALKKRELLLREREVKVRIMELSNFEKEQKLKLHVISVVGTMKVK